MELRITNPQESWLTEQILWNNEELKAAIAEKVKDYKTIAYTEDSLKDMKADRADLNKLKKAFEDERKRVKKICMEPYTKFEQQVKEITALIDEPIGLIDSQIREIDERRKAAKREEIEELFASIGFQSFVKLDMIWDEKWLNATVTLPKIEEQMKSRMYQIGTDVVTISKLPEFKFEAMEVYRKTLDMNQAIQEGQRLADIQKRKLEAERMEAERKAREAIGVDELIYYMFSDRHRQKPDPDRRYDRIYIGGDYGQQNATTFEAFGLDTYRKKFPGLGEYYHSGRESGRQKSPSEYARDLVEFMDGLHEQYENRIFYIFLDPSAKGLAEEVRRATRTGLDYQVFLRDAENDVALGISRVQKALVFDIMSISPKQEYAVQEFGTYEYDKKSIEKGKEVPVKEADHCMDAIRYVVMGAWSNIKHWLPLDIVEDDVNIGDIGSREVREEDEYL